jgi:DNA repair protein RadC
MTYLPFLTLKKEPSIFENKKLKSSKECADFIRQFYGDDISIFESFFLLCLNRSNTTISYAKISQGGVTGTVVDNSIILKYVVDSLATGIIIAHNHPSGNLKPSEADIRVTKDLQILLKILKVNLLDHIILTEDSYYSFLDNDAL